MRAFEDKYRVDRTSRILESENAFRSDVDLRLDALETAATAFAAAANEARDAIIRGADLEIAPRVAQMVSILNQYNGNANALRDAVLAIVRDGVDTRGDTLKKLLAQVDAATATATALTSQFTSLATLLDNKSNVGHGHDLANIVGATQALDGKLSKVANLQDLDSASAARTNLGLGTASTKDTGSDANKIPLLDATGQLITQRNAAAAGWGAASKSIGVSNESGVYFDANNNAAFIARNGSGVLRTRWDSVNPSAHLVDGLPALLPRAWVNFNGTGTIAIRNGQNISSISKNGTGDYTINFTTPMPDTNYGVMMSWQTHESGGHQSNDNVFMSLYNGASLNTGSVRVNSQYGNLNASFDMWTVCVTIIR